MINGKKTLRRFGKLALCLIAAASVSTCTQVPDNCGKRERYTPASQFCFNGKAKDKCGGSEYNPLTDVCMGGTTVGTRCEDGTAVPFGTPCGGYTLSVGKAPEDGGGVTVEPSMANFAPGEGVTLVATEGGGYEFIGWTGAEEVDTKQVTLRMVSNKSIIAMFSPSSPPDAATHTLVAVAFPKEGGTVLVNGDEPTGETTTHSSGATVDLSAQPNEGYTFKGWSGAVTSTSESESATMDGGKTVVAVFAPIEYPLTVNVTPVDAGAIFANGSALYQVDTPVEAWTKVTMLARPDDGYAFTGWKGAINKADSIIEFTMSGPMTLTANFKLIR